MNAVEFPQQHGIIAKDQPEYIPLPVHYKTERVKFKDEHGKDVIKEVVMEVTACFKLDPEEVAQVISTGVLWYTQCVYGNQFQPIRMSLVNPFEPTQAAPPQSPITRLVEALKTDEGYREGWRANLAAAFVDSFDKWIRDDTTEAGQRPLFSERRWIANRAADNFLNQLCNNKPINNEG